MDNISLLIVKWKHNVYLATKSRQEQIIFGAKKKEVSAIDAYISLFNEFINDLKNIKEI